MMKSSTYCKFLLITVIFSNILNGQLLKCNKSYHIKLNNEALSSINILNSQLNSTVIKGISSGIKPTLNPKIPNTSPKPKTISEGNQSNIPTKDSIVIEPFCQNCPNQKWIVEYNGAKWDAYENCISYPPLSGNSTANTFYRIKNGLTGKYLTRKSFPSTSSPGYFEDAIISAELDTNNPGQKWLIAFDGVDDLGSREGMSLGTNSKFRILIYGPDHSGGDRTNLYYNKNAPNLADRKLMLQKYVLSGANASFTFVPSKPAEKIRLTDLGAMCPTALLKGDREFNTGLQGLGLVNHTMSFRVNIDLSISENKKEIWAKIYMIATENGGDETQTERTWDYKVYTAPAGKNLKKFVSNPHFMVQSGNSNVRGLMKLKDINSDIVEHIFLVADTNGDDVSTDENCDDDTRIEKIKFNEIFVEFN